jgi:hypothetical protein
LEDEILEDALTQKGLKVYRTNWDNQNFDWETAHYAIFRATWDYFGNEGGSGEPGMRLTTKFAVAVTLNGVLNLTGASTILAVGSIGSNGLLSDVGVAVQITTTQIILQVYDTSLNTEIRNLANYSEGLRRIVMVWNGVDTLQVYGDLDNIQPYQLEKLSLLDTLTLPSPVTNNYCSARSFDIINMINTNATASRTLRILEVKALYTF